MRAAGPTDITLSPDKQADEAAFLGYAFVTAYNAVLANTDPIEGIVARLVRDKEVYGSELEQLLTDSGLKRPSIEWQAPLLPPGVAA